jgi:tetratricopeptide (TPR) repeat protein
MLKPGSDAAANGSSRLAFPGEENYFMPVRATSRFRSRVKFLAPLVFLVPALSAGAGRALSGASRGSGTRPNVLLVTIDTLRADRVGVYDSGRRLTPNIDRWAADAVVFERAYAHTVTTLPSHANILLGATPPFHGVHDNTNFIVPPGVPTMAAHLKAAGYATGAFIGGFPLDSRFGLGRGFDLYDDDLRTAERDPGIEAGRERRAQAVLDRALDWLAGRTSSWFLWVHLYDPHDPYAPPEPFRSRHAKDPYDGEVAYADSVLGGLFGRLRDSRDVANTLVVLTGDHGESLGDHGERTHGFLAYEAALRIPLIIREPGIAPGRTGRRVAAPVSHADIFPTVCEAIGLRPPAGLQGASLRPLMSGDRPAARPIYFESLSPALNLGWGPITGFIRGSEKFIESPVPELYDLDKDSLENTNLAPGRDLASFRKELGRIAASLSAGAPDKARRTPDRATREILQSLGYLAGGTKASKPGLGPDADVKTLLPLQNKAMDALDLFNAGKVREATETLKEVIASEKAVSAAYLNLATIYKKQGRPADAAAVLKLGIEKMPDVYDLFVQYVAGLYEAGDSAGVIEIFESADVSQANSDPVIWNFAGLAYWSAGKAVRAKECFARSMELDPKFAVPHNSLGTVLAFEFKSNGSRETYNRAAGEFARAIELDPAYAAAYHGLGVVHFQAKAYDKAIASFKRALELGIELDETHYFLGISHFVRGELEAALASLTAFRDSPSFARLGPAEKVRLDGYIAECRKKDRRKKQGGPAAAPQPMSRS